MRERSQPAVARFAIAALLGLALLGGCRVEQKPAPKPEASTVAPAAPATVAPAPTRPAPAAAPAAQSAAPAEPSKAAPAAASTPAASGIGRIDSLEGGVRVVRSAGDRAG